MDFTAVVPATLWPWPTCESRLPGNSGRVCEGTPAPGPRRPSLPQVNLPRNRGHILEDSELKEPEEVGVRGFRLHCCRALIQTKEHMLLGPQSIVGVHSVHHLPEKVSFPGSLRQTRPAPTGSV